MRCLTTMVEELHRRKLDGLDHLVLRYGYELILERREEDTVRKVHVI